MKWKPNKCLPRLCSLAELPITITIKSRNPHIHPKDIVQYDISKAHCTLGVCLAPHNSDTVELTHITKKTVNICKCLKICKHWDYSKCALPIMRISCRHNVTASLLWFFVQANLKRIQTHLLRDVLPLMGINNFSCALVNPSILEGGLGLLLL